MHRLYLAFLRGVATNWWAKLGAALTTGSFVLFVVFELSYLSGGTQNPYFDLLVFMFLPALFVGGLLLIGFGWWRFGRAAKKQGLSTKAMLALRFGDANASPGALGSRVLWIVGGLTVLNIVVVGGTTAQMKSHMDGPKFCGTTCHVMNPEWTAYQDSPHRNVACVDCHVGDGAQALVASKLRGLGQMYEHARAIYNRPIPTPVHTLSSARETCERCHSPEADYGTPVRVLTRHASDRASTPLFSTLAMKIGSGGGERGVAHWHASKNVVIDYGTRDSSRRTVDWVTVELNDGSEKQYARRGVARGAIDKSTARRMDCVDCHNRPAHQFDNPEAKIDELIIEGTLDRRWPFVKRKALSALTANYTNATQAAARIRASFAGYYGDQHPQLAALDRKQLERATNVLISLWKRNIHPAMKVTWDSYPSLVGHRTPGEGCFRCHNSSLLDEKGRSIPHDCTLCHSLLAHESTTPFANLTPSKDDPFAEPNGELGVEYLSRYLGTERATRELAAPPRIDAPPEADNQEADAIRSE